MDNNITKDEVMRYLKASGLPRMYRKLDIALYLKGGREEELSCILKDPTSMQDFFTEKPILNIHSSNYIKAREALMLAVRQIMLRLTGDTCFVYLHRLVKNDEFNCDLFETRRIVGVPDMFAADGWLCSEGDPRYVMDALKEHIDAGGFILTCGTTRIVESTFYTGSFREFIQSFGRDFDLDAGT